MESVLTRRFRHFPRPVETVFPPWPASLLENMFQDPSTTFTVGSTPIRSSVVGNFASEGGDRVVRLIPPIGTQLLQCLEHRHEDELH